MPKSYNFGGKSVAEFSRIWVLSSCLKAFMFPIIENNPRNKHLKLRKHFTNEKYFRWMRDVYLIYSSSYWFVYKPTQSSNLFSRINCIMTVWSKRLSSDHRSILLRIGGKSGPAIEFEPKRYADLWYFQKFQRLTTVPQMHPTTQRNMREGSTNKVIFLTVLTIASVLEDKADQERSGEGFQAFILAIWKFSS